MGYTRPVGPKINDTWRGHKNRRPKPSSEPGIDYRCGVGTPVRAPADGIVRGIKNTTTGAMGRAIMLQTGRDWHRALHLSEIKVTRVGQHVTQGQIIALSGASANGKENGVGQHLHWTFWFDHGRRAPIPGSTPTDDFELFIDRPGFVGAAVHDQEDDMFTDADRVLLRQIKLELMNTKAGLWSGGRSRIDGSVQTFDYGALPIVVENQKRIGKLAGQLSAIQAIVEQLVASQNVPIDMDMVRDAAERGTREVESELLNGVVVSVSLDPDAQADPGLDGDLDPELVDAIDPLLQGEIDPPPEA